MDDSMEDTTAITATEISTDKINSQFNPLDINCEVALSFIADYVRSENFPSEVQLSHFTTLSNSTFLDQIAELMLIPTLSECVSIAFYPILPAIVGRWAMSGDQVDRIACAFGRVIFLEPKLKRYAQEFLLSGPSFLRSIAHLTPQLPPEELARQFSAINVDELREILLAAFRLVLFSRSNFLRFLAPTPLLALLQHPDRPIRYLALELLCFTVGIADAAKSEWTKQYLGGPEDEIMGFWENVTIDYGVLPVLESQRLYNAKKIIRERDYFQQGHGRKLAVSDLRGFTGEICGVLIPRFGGTIPSSTTLVMTENTRRNLREMATRVVAEEPMLLESVSGAGKSFLIDEIAKLFGRYDDIVRITLTDQTDAKILLGTYVTSTPGSFTWRAGILTTAVKEGKWIVIEDIERAGNDVLSVLLPLLEGRPLELSGRGQVEMAKGGQLIVTTRLLSGSKSAQVENMLGIQRWSRVAIIPPTDHDLLEIINNLLPRLKFLAPVLLRVYSTLRELSDNPMMKLSRQLSPRDLLKWTKRTSSLCLRVEGETIPREIWDDIFLEAVDCFAAMIPSVSTRHTIVEKIGTEMGFPMERINLYLESHAPNLTDDSRLLQVGRISIPKKPGTSRRNPRPFAYTNHARRLVEQLAVAVLHREPLLLVGETGTGKTTIVQHLADMLHHRLVVVNVSQQTESSDLLGGFKPVDPRTIAIQIKESFERLFEATFSIRRNELFISRVNKYYSSQKWTEFVKLLKEASSKAVQRFQTPPPDEGVAKKKRRVEGDIKEQWAKFSDELAAFELQLTTGKGKSHAFSFVEGSLVKALKRGDWILLDEVNLAAADTLESISGLIREDGSVTLPEKADLEAIKPHPDFRIFACMNPATDVGKRDLPAALRGQFTEFYVGSPDESMADLLLIIKQYIGHLCVGDERAVSDVAQLYMKVKSAAERHDIVDGVGQKPHFSIRTLTRTLTYVTDTSSMYGLRRALYEGFCMSFSTMLECGSRETVMLAISEALYPAGNRTLRAALRSLPKRPQDDSIQLGNYWIEKGDQLPQENPLYIVKENTSVERNLHNLVRASLTRRYPILLQGPTSSGKTSMIEHMAKLTGHKFLRINNHEHTSLDEYLGTYISAPTGEFVFQEGILIEALRKGHWIVLDELNLAPSDVLEALNRLLDDNRELLIPETQEVIIPHPHFMLFATQNPAGLYGGRKVLSRAFRNRFLELEFDDIPEDELEEILYLRCKIPPSYGARIVEVYKQLSLQRQSTRLFEQRNSFATLRDLFRWAQREAVGYQQLAENGYMLLAERVRKVEERLVVKQVIERVMKVKIDDNSLYDPTNLGQSRMTTNLIWTKSMRRLFILVNRALINNEPVLLVGETGSGKTTVCQVLAEMMGTKLHIINAHQNTETGDIIGSQRPFRDRLMYQSRLVEELRKFFSHRPGSTEMALDDLAEEFSKLDVEQLLASSANPHDISAKIDLIRDNFGRQRTLFEWVDGALVQAMKKGEFFLLDEISLAEDSVLERLNSVLESSRSIVLAEKGGDEVHVTAADGFQFLATMNPGGDYGKKELSPALRNRFTEIWVPAVEDCDDLIQIIQASLVAHTEASSLMVDFAEWFTKRSGSTGTTISIRDMLAWVHFINATYSTLSLNLSLFHGAMMVYVDGIGTTSGTEFVDVAKEKSVCISYLSSLLRQDLSVEYTMPVKVVASSDSFMLGHFAIPRGSETDHNVPFSFEAPTTAANGMKVIRAMQLPKSILLEGAPGIGKTSLITAIAAAAGQRLTRINLSDQTDLMDLFGSDVPVEGGRGGEFAWRDAPFLRAMQNGGWVLLDELNLASQSVLEGLNACLDHRGSAYVPELNRSFARHHQFRIFAAQNPHSQGGGRKGLPKSFINRFSVVHVESLTQEDMCTIGSQVFPAIPTETVSSLISFIMTVQDEAQSSGPFGSLGRPWEFNLRDVLRWLELVQSQGGFSKDKSAADYLHLVISQRLRTKVDQQRLAKLFEQLVGPLKNHPIVYSLGLDTFQAGMVVTGRRKVIVAPKQIEAAISIQQSGTMEVLSLCIENAWPSILVGPSGSGKTSMIRALASVNGASLQEFSMNSDTDATDILGGYEQRDPCRQLSSVAADLRNQICELLALAPGSMEHALYGKVVELCSLLPSSSSEASSLYTAFNEVLGNMGSQSQYVLGLVDSVQKLLFESVNDQETGKFQWYDGVLIDALRKGSWIILDNANLCNPSVLDRLNSLLEPNGSLVLHECTDASGAPRIIVPHKNFRLFITMDPRYGELSRPMRNRTVEVAVHGRPDKISNDFPLHMYSGMESLLRFLQQTFTLFCDKPESWPIENQIKFAGQLLEYVPTQSLPYLRRWLKSNIPSQFGQATQHLAFNLQLLMELPPATDLITYNHIASSNIGLTSSFADSQNLLPLLNDFLPLSVVAPELKSFEVNAELLSGTYDLCVTFSNMRRKLHDLQQAALKADRSETRELVLASKRSEKGASLSLQPAVSTLSLLNKLSDQLRTWLIARTYLESDVQDITDLNDLFTLWFEMVQLLNEENLDPSYYIAFRNLLEAWTDRVNASILSDFISQVRSQLKALSNSVELSTGMSMSLIWTMARPCVPSNLEQWGAYDKLTMLIKDFESKVAFQDHNLDAVISIKSSFLEALCALLSSKSSEFPVQSFQIDELDIDKAVTPPGSDIFTDGFRGLHNVLQIQMDGSLDSERGLLLHLSHLSGNSILQSLDSVITGGTSAFESIFRTLPGIEAILIVLEQISRVQLFKHSVAISRVIHTTNNVEFDSVLRKLRIFGKLFSQTADYAIWSDAAALFSLMEEDIKELLQIHVESNSITLAARRAFSSLLSLLKYRFDVDAPAEPESVSEKLPPSVQYAIQEIRLAISAFIAGSQMNNDNSEQFSFVAATWVRFSLACISLYVPDKPNDPAAVAILNVKRSNLREADLSATFQSRLFIEQRLRGPNGSRRLTSDAEKLKQATIDSKGLLKSEVYRPKMSQVSQIQQDLNQLLEITIKSNRFDMFLKDPGSRTSEIKTIIENLKRLATKLEVNYPYYKDSLAFIIGTLYTLIFGLTLLLDLESKKTLQAGRVQLPAQPFLSMASVTIPPTVQSWMSYRESISSFEGPITLFNLCMLERVCLASSIKDSASPPTAIVRAILDDSYRQWRIAKERKKAEEAAKTSIYKRKDEEFELEQAIAEYFPDQELDDDALENKSQAEDEESGAKIYALHRTLFTDSNGNTTTVTIGDVLNRGLQLVAKCSDAFSSYHIMLDSFPSHLLSLASAKRFLGHIDSTRYDFYRSPNFPENRQFIELLSDVHRKTKVFLEDWPDHANLHDIFLLCDRVMTLPASAPLSRLLSYVERLYSLMDQWQEVASRDYSLAEYYEKVKDTIIRWRRLELGCWKTLLIAEADHHREDVASWWFDIYESVIYNLRVDSMTDFPEHLAKVVASLDGFMSAGTLGDYDERLRLLASFALHARSESTDHPALEHIYRSCSHMYRLYALYASEMQRSMEQQKIALEKEVSETVQLASWRDTSVFALTESAKRSHRRLYKTVRKYRDLLSEPITPILQRGAIADFPSVAIISNVLYVPFTSEVDQETIAWAVGICERKNIWSVHSRILLDPRKISSSVQNIFRRFDASRSDVAITVDDFIETVENLRKQTPSILTDENEKQVKFLKTQKRRVFAQTMKSLREWGITSKSANPNVNDASRMSLTPVRSGYGTDSAQSRIDYHFYNILELLPRVRAAGLEHSPDLSDDEFHRAHGYVEALIDGMFDQRSLVYDFEDAVSSLRTASAQTLILLVDQIKSTEDIQWIVSPSAGRYMASRIHILQRLIVVIETCISALSAQLEIDEEARVQPLSTFLKTLLKESQTWLARLNHVSWNDNIVFPDAVSATLRVNDFENTEGTDTWVGTDSLDNWLFMTSPTISELVSLNYPELLYAIQPILDVLKSTDEWEKLSPTPIANTMPDVTMFQEAAESLGTMTLVATQELSKVLAQVETATSINYPQMKRLQREITKLLNPSTVKNKVMSMYEEAIPLLSSQTGLQHVLAVFNSLVPILGQYINGCQLVQFNLEKYHEAYCQMTHVLLIAFHTLTTKGYCSPQREDKASGPTEGQGVGLGEGEGQTDISNEIKDDEDLSDLAKQEKGESNESNDVADQDDGVEMDDDFDGALEDAPDGEDEEEGSDGEDEMDEGTGAVDDADPSAVDEQFWEDQAKQQPESADEKQTKGKKELEEEGGELGASNEKEQKERKEGKEEVNDPEDAEGPEEEEGSNVDESALQNREDDTMMPEAQPLDIADDLDLMQPDGEAKTESIFSDDEMDLDEQAGDDHDIPDESLSDNDLEEHRDEEDMEAEGEERPDGEEMVEEDNLNTQNVDQSEYVGEDAAQSEAFGKGGDSATTEEKHEGAQGDESTEEIPDSANQSSSNPIEGATAQGNGHLDSNDLRKETTDEQNQSNATKDNPFRKLGDMLEQWRRDLQTIQDVASEEHQEEKTVGEQNPEFSYVGEDEQFDTQGLGPAAPDQVQPLDMSMAIEDEEPSNGPEAKSREDIPDETPAQGIEVDSTSHPTSFGASIGDRSKDPDRMDFDQVPATTIDELPQRLQDTVEIHNTITISSAATENAREIWQQHDRATHDLSLSLCEQLRLILEPTLATKMRGDFRTGKRLNMRRIIPYIASDYKKDKIWMRRTKPSKRQYQIMIAIDDSKSMSDSKSVKLAFDTLALTAKAMSQLEVGQIGIVRFGEDVKVVHGFEEQFTSESGGKIVQQFQFDQSRTDVYALTKSSIELFNIARAQQDIRSSVGTELWQLELIISDGICEDHDTIRRMVREAFEAKIMMVFVILDAIHPERKDSILDIKSYSFESSETGQTLRETRYLDSFPFNYFVIVRDVAELPSVLASALRQWFAEVAEL